MGSQLFLFFFLSFIFSAKAQDVQNSRTSGDSVIYWACFSLDIRASVSGFVNFTQPTSDTKNGAGVVVNITILDASRGPFTYSVHSGTCPDPTGEPFELWQKWGVVPAFRGSLSVFASYFEPALSVKEGTAAFVRGRSVVLRDAMGMRKACAAVVDADEYPYFDAPLPKNGEESFWKGAFAKDGEVGMPEEPLGKLGEEGTWEQPFSKGGEGGDSPSGKDGMQGAPIRRRKWATVTLDRNV